MVFQSEINSSQPHDRINDVSRSSCFVEFEPKLGESGVDYYPPKSVCCLVRHDCGSLAASGSCTRSNFHSRSKTLRPADRVAFVNLSPNSSHYEMVCERSRFIRVLSLDEVFDVISLKLVVSDQPCSADSLQYNVGVVIERFVIGKQIQTTASSMISCARI